MKKHYYAVESRYGLNILDDDNKIMGYVVVFESKKDRDVWVDETRSKNYSDWGMRAIISAKYAKKYDIRDWRFVYPGPFFDSKINSPFR